MDTLVLERAATELPAETRPKLSRKNLAIAGLALAVSLGGIGYGRYWWRLCENARSGGPGWAPCSGLSRRLISSHPCIAAISAGAPRTAMARFRL
jgi:hypothetical protein